MKRRALIPAFVGMMTVALTSVSSGSAQTTQVVAANHIVIPPLESVMSRPVTVSVHQVSLEQAIMAVVNKANVRIGYEVAYLDAIRQPVTLVIKNVPLETALGQVLQGTGLQVRHVAADLLKLERASIRLTQGTITGKVVNEKTKAPIAGATITLDGVKSTATTDNQGQFRLAVPSGSYLVRVRALGYTRAEKSVTVGDDESASIEFALETSTNTLAEVVVTGTVVATERKAIATPITVFTAKDLQDRGITNLEQLFRGEIPGVVALDLGSAAFTRSSLGGTASSTVISRGGTSVYNSYLNAANPLKTYVDGIELSDPTFLGTLDPNSIERIEVLTGPQAATIYGSGAMGGVMQIFTKKGTGSSRHDVTMNLKYGMLQNSLSRALAPQHNHVVNYSGGSGAVLSYAVNASYNYTGQWTPGVFNRQMGVNVGLTHTIGPVNVTGTFNTTLGRNGTVWGNPREYYLTLEGIQSTATHHYGLQSSTVGTQNNQTLGLNATFRVANSSQHTVTIGRSGSVFDLIPQDPVFRDGNDSLFYYQNRTTHRTTGAYTVVFNQVRLGTLTADLSTGINGSSGSNALTRGYKGQPVQSTLVNMTGSLYPDESSAGMFGSLRLGLFGSLYTTMALRVERNDGYGDKKSTDFTPSNGIAYTLEAGDVSLKLMGSYGRATRAPQLEQKLGRKTVTTTYDPGEYWSVLPNEFITPEYSRGPQGGFELYYGNVASLNVNHYQQQVTDLIRPIVVDSFHALVIETGEMRYVRQQKNVNAASLRSRGWELSGHVNVLGLRVSGTYSANRSKILSLGPNVAITSVNDIAIPSRSGNLTINYAHGGTSMTLVSNYIGQQRTSYGQGWQETRSMQNARLVMYQEAGKRFSPSWMQPGYTKFNLVASHRVASWLDLTANIVNLTNSFSQEPVINSWFYPTLGRTSTFGVAMRFPR